MHHSRFAEQQTSDLAVPVKKSDLTRILLRGIMKMYVVISFYKK